MKVYEFHGFFALESDNTNPNDAMEQLAAYIVGTPAASPVDVPLSEKMKAGEFDRDLSWQRLVSNLETNGRRLVIQSSIHNVASVLAK